MSADGISTLGRAGADMVSSYAFPSASTDSAVADGVRVMAVGADVSGATEPPLSGFSQEVLLRRRDVAAFRDGGQFLSVDDFLHESILHAPCVGVVGIDVKAHDVHSVVPGVPLGGFGLFAALAVNGPNPEDVVQPMVLLEAVLDQIPELFAIRRTVFSPPEARTAVTIIAGSLVQGAEQDRNAFVLQEFQRNGHLVDVLENEFMLPGAFFKGFADVEGGF